MMKVARTEMHQGLRSAGRGAQSVATVAFTSIRSVSLKQSFFCKHQSEGLGEFCQISHRLYCSIDWGSVFGYTF